MGNPVAAYIQAAEAESRARDAAFLGLPEEVCGVALRALTLRDYLWLSAARSPFVIGGRPEFEDVALLLWHQRLPMPRCLAGETIRGRVRRWLGFTGQTTEAPEEKSRRHFLRALECLDVETLIRETGDFVARAMMDAPQGEVGKRSTSYYSFAVGLIHSFRREYHAGSDEVMDTDLRVLWQFERHIGRERNPGAHLFNRSDSFKREAAAAIAAARRLRKEQQQQNPIV